MNTNKIIIIEGPDNIGKDTIINGLLNYFNNIKIYHFTSPEKYAKENLLSYYTNTAIQKIQFKTIFNEISNLNFNGLIILNRSHLGEFVYGPLYRKTNANWIFKDIENDFKDLFNNIGLILLTAPVEHLIKNDDGKSYSTNIENRKNENILFKEAYNKSLIKQKIILDVYDYNKNNFIDKKIIINKVNNFINGFNKCN